MTQEAPDLQRVFLGLEKPALVAAVDYLFQRYRHEATVDLSKVLLALPGQRAGRRLLEILVCESQHAALTLIPPRIVTASGLAEHLVCLPRPAARGIERALAWSHALAATDQRRLAAVFPTLPDPGDTLGWLALGEIVSQLHEELAAADLGFPDVASAVAEMGDETEVAREVARWHALASVLESYLDMLDQVSLTDSATARRRAVANRGQEARPDLDIVLVGMADLSPPIARKLLGPVLDRVTALVHAPAEWADRFDSLGCARAEIWRSVPIDLARTPIELEDGPAEQAAHAAAVIGEYLVYHHPAEITIGAPDGEVATALDHRLRTAGISGREAIGKPFPRSAVGQLLEAIARFVDRGSFRDLAALARHPAAQALLQVDDAIDWPSLLDLYHSEHLPFRLVSNETGGRRAAWLVPSRERDALVRLDERIARWLGPLVERQARPLSEWAQPILDVLIAAFGHEPIDLSRPNQRARFEECAAAHAALVELARLPDSLSPVVGAADALGIVMRRLARESVPPPPDARAIEILGWLELPLDDAPVLVLTGFNEGYVPASINSDLFLPNQLRARLGMLDNDRRYARDAYALSVLVASRPQVRIFLGRRSAEGDPLMPSRLLFACPESELAARVLRYFDPGTPPPDKPASEPTRPSAARLAIPRPRPLAKPIEGLRVTAFRDYLACPYRFYLRHALGLVALGDEAEELDGRAFGTLAHEVLRDFALGPAAHETSAPRIQEWLEERLRAITRQRFGQAAAPAVWIQERQLRWRLDEFARWQAGWRSEGWRIHEVERGVTGQEAPLWVDGIPFFLRGRIDRIDMHEATGAVCVLDYKTSDSANGPRETHQRQETWIDLQLPLYRQLLAGLGLPATGKLGYILLPKVRTKTGIAWANWSADELASADQCAADVIRAIRREEFWPPADPPPLGFDEFARICQEEQFRAEDDEEA